MIECFIILTYTCLLLYSFYFLGNYLINWLKINYYLSANKYIQIAQLTFISKYLLFIYMLYIFLLWADCLWVRSLTYIYIFISSLWCGGKARRWVLPLKTQCLQNSAESGLCLNNWFPLLTLLCAGYSVNKLNQLHALSLVAYTGKPSSLHLLSRHSIFSLLNSRQRHCMQLVLPERKNKKKSFPRIGTVSKTPRPISHY